MDPQGNQLIKDLDASFKSTESKIKLPFLEQRSKPVALTLSTAPGGPKMMVKPVG
jgi:hypothetical protein